MKQSGLSIIDFAIGSAIVLITAVIILPQFIKVSNSTQISQENIYCLNAADSIMSKVITHKPMQIRNYSVSTNALGGKVLSLYPQQKSYTIDWIFPDLATSWSPVEFKNGKNIINGVYLQTGAIARATNFYNYSIANNKDICEDYIGLTDAIDLLPNAIIEKNFLLEDIKKQKSKLTEASYYIKISKSNGASSNGGILTRCERPFVPAPSSYQAIDLQNSPALSLSLPEKSLDKAGFYISIKHTYQNKEGKKDSCEVSRYLAPQIDSVITNPEPEISIDFSPGRDQPNEFKEFSEFNLKLPNKQGFSARKSCRVERQAFGDVPAFTPQRQDRMESDWEEPLKVIKINVKIGFNSLNPGEAGTIFLCRDQSVQYNKNYCGLKNFETLDPKLQPWVPCEVATLCGVPVDGSQLIANSISEGQSHIELPFIMNANTKVSDPNSNLMVSSPQAFIGCDMRMDIAAVDIAGNSYSISNSKRASYHNDLESQRAHIFQMFYQPTDCWNCKIYKYRSLFSRLVRGMLGVALYVANLYTGGAVGTIVSVIQLVAAPVAVSLPPLQDSVTINAVTPVVVFAEDPRIKKINSALETTRIIKKLYENAECKDGNCKVQPPFDIRKQLNGDLDKLKQSDKAELLPQVAINYSELEKRVIQNTEYGHIIVGKEYGGWKVFGNSSEQMSEKTLAEYNQFYGGLEKQLNEALALVQKSDTERQTLVPVLIQGPSKKDEEVSASNSNAKDLWMKSCKSVYKEDHCQAEYDLAQAEYARLDDYGNCLTNLSDEKYCKQANQPAIEDDYDRCRRTDDHATCYAATQVAKGSGAVLDPIDKANIPIETPTWVNNVKKSAKYLNTLADVYNLRMAYLSGDNRKVTESLIVLGLANKAVQEQLDKYIFDGLLKSINSNYDNIKSGIANPIAQHFSSELKVNEAWKSVIEDSANAFASSLINNTLKGLLYGKIDAKQIVKDSVKASAHAAVSSVVDKALSKVVNDMLIKAGALQNAVPMTGFLNVDLIKTFGGFGHGPGKLVKETKNCTDETQTWKTGRWFSRRKWAKRCERTPIRSPAWVQTAGIPACEYNAKLHYAFPYQHISFVAGYTLPGEVFEAPIYFDSDEAVVCQAKFSCTGSAETKTSFFTAQPPKPPKDNDQDETEYYARSTNHCDAIMTRVKYKFSYIDGVLSYNESNDDNRCRMNQPFEDVYDQVGQKPVLKTIDQQMPYPSAAKYAEMYQACDKYGPLNQNPIYEQSMGQITQVYTSSTATQVQYRLPNCPPGLSCQAEMVGSSEDGIYEYIITKNILRDRINFHLCQPVMNNGIPISINFPTDINANLPKISREFYVLEHRKPYNAKLPDCFNNERKYTFQISEEPGFNILARHELNLEKEMMAEAANICGEINKANAVIDFNDPNLVKLSNQEKQYAAQFKIGFDSLSFFNFSNIFPRTDHLVGWAKNRGNYQIHRTDYNMPSAPHCTGYQDIEIGTIDNEYGEPKTEVRARCHQCAYSLPSTSGYNDGY